MIHIDRLLSKLWLCGVVLGSCGPSIVLATEDEAGFRRLLVRCAAREIAPRTSDECPAELTLEAEGGRSIDLATLRVVRTDPRTGEERPGPLPFRWYDDAIPYDFPEAESYANNTDGVRLPTLARPRWGDLSNVLGEGKSGRLVWLHRQDGKDATTYAVSYQRLPEGKAPNRLPPRGFVGDGSHRCAPLGASTTGNIHSRVSVTDWDRDGKLDLVVGVARGQVLLYRNLGTRERPEYLHAEYLKTHDGSPIDVGWSAAPITVDWDRDGRVDVLCGAEKNCLLFYRNEGTAPTPSLVPKGFLLADGKRLTLPVEPVPKSPPGVYTQDYYPVPEAADWDGDGDLDLLAGGFVTGRIYWFRNDGKTADGLPLLSAQGPLILADGHPLNVGDWAASPCLLDADGDGDLDLISGNMPMTDGGGDASSSEHFLRYYENTGTRQRPALVERAFPKVGEFPNRALGTPRVGDWNGDGRLDLVVSSAENIYLYANVGINGLARFEVHSRPLPGPWGSMPVPSYGAQFVDRDRDGTLELLSGLTLYRDAGGRDYRPEPLLRSGEAIDHPAPRGDSWMFTQLADLDGDGRLDLLYGTHEGNIYLHRDLGGNPPRFDQAGTKLETTEGPIQVGKPPGSSIDFDALQGARTTFTASDFDRDGVVDLVVGDTYGKVRFYRGRSMGIQPRFEPPVELGDLKIRMVPFSADWDGDGLIDVVGTAASGTVVVYRNLGNHQFAAAEPINVPATPYSPVAVVVDWNGDGDSDLLVNTAYGFSCWFERSFLDHGYAKATIVRRDQTPGR